MAVDIFEVATNHALWAVSAITGRLVHDADPDDWGSTVASQLS